MALSGRGLKAQSETKDTLPEKSFYITVSP